jgi:hypothetical protein
MKIKPELMEKFEAVFPKAAAISASTPGYLSHDAALRGDQGQVHYPPRSRPAPRATSRTKCSAAWRPGASTTT